MADDDLKAPPPGAAGNVLTSKGSGVGGGADNSKEPVPDWIKAEEKRQGLAKGGSVSRGYANGGSVSKAGWRKWGW